MEFEAAKQKIDEKYGKFERNAEYFAYYSEQVLGNKYTLEKLLEAEPTLKDMILSFFKGASTDYADVPKLSSAAKKYYRTYKKLFDEFSARNAENNAIEKPLTSMKTENMQFSGRQYAFMGHNADNIEVYETSDEVLQLPWRERKKKYLSYIDRDYLGRTAKFVRNGHAYYAEFERKEASKAIYGDDRSDPAGRDALINTGADGTIFELVENSEYSRSAKDTKGHNKTDYFDYFVKTVQIDGKVFDLLADVKKKYYKDGGFVYTLRLVENKKIKASPIQRGQALLKNSGNALINNSISQKSKKSNTSTKKSSENSSGKDFALDIDSEEGKSRCA